MTLGFFDDILIPPTALQHPSRFEEAEQAWVWEYPLEDGEKHDLYMDIGEPIKFRVSGEVFEENSPVGPPSLADKPSTSSQTEVKTPYRIVVSIPLELRVNLFAPNDSSAFNFNSFTPFQAAINESGLGLLSWWDQQNQQTDDADDVGEEYEE